MNTNQKQTSEPATNKPAERRRDLSKATAMHILGPSKNLNKENEVSGTKTINDNTSIINPSGMHSNGDVSKPPRDQRKH